ncbi:hypothetical protein GF420_07225 [candidate division GN15 bacterium]|nr:hypothetical protein [candidate division GN15 bacterium]
MKRLLITLAVALLVIPVGIDAKDMNRKYGLGYFNTDAPVGGRIWVSPTIGIDLGVGFEGKTIYESANGGDPEKSTATSFWFEAGVPIVVFPSERANFFIRPGVQVASLDNRIYGEGPSDAKWTRITPSATLGAEVFFGDHFSLEAGHGIAVDITSVPDEDGITEVRRGESETEFRTFDASIAYLGFHFYFR